MEEDIDHPYDEELADSAERGELIPGECRILRGAAAQEAARKLLLTATGVNSWEEFERRELTDHTD